MRPQSWVLAFIFVSLPAAAWDVRTDSQGDVVRWGHALTMVLDQNAAEQLNAPGAEDAIRAAVANLDEATPFLDVSVRVGAAKQIGYVVGATDNTNSIVVLDEWPYAQDALAMTLVTLNTRTNEILDADVAFNRDEHRFKVLPANNRNNSDELDDVQNTFTHELGHVLGLMHNNHSEDLVMFPSAIPGETVKRELKGDDRDGLLSLYGNSTQLAPTTEELAPPVGCSSTGSAPVWAFMLPLMVLVLRRRRLALAMAVVPALAFADTSPVAVKRAVDAAQDVAVVELGAHESRFHPRYPGLIVTTFTFSRRECLKGACAQLETLELPGGRVGDIEQFVAHEPLPTQGARVVVVRNAGRVQLMRVDPDLQARLLKALRNGSSVPLGLLLPQSAVVQVPAITP